jgi:hypothetical protein
MIGGHARPSSAAVIPMSAKRRGASTTAMWSSARSRSVSAIPVQLRDGNCAAASIQEAGLAECTGGTTETFDKARAAFERA